MTRRNSSGLISQNGANTEVNATFGLGTRPVRARIRVGLDQADALGGLGQELRTLLAEADRELADLRAGRSI